MAGVQGCDIGGQEVGFILVFTVSHASLWGQKKVIFKGGWKEKIRCSSTTRGNGEQGGEAIFEDLEAEDISKAMK